MCLYHFALPEKAGFGLAADAAKSHCSSMYRHSYPSRGEVRRVHVNVLLQFSRGHFIVAVFLAPLYALVVIRQKFAQLKKTRGRHTCVWITIDYGITVQFNSKRLGEIIKSSSLPFIHQ